MKRLAATLRHSALLFEHATDKRDARALCEACRLGAYRHAHRTSERQRRIRSQLLVRSTLVRTRSKYISLIGSPARLTTGSSGHKETLSPVGRRRQRLDSSHSTHRLSYALAQEVPDALELPADLRAHRGRAHELTIAPHPL